MRKKTLRSLSAIILAATAAAGAQSCDKKGAETENRGSAQAASVSVIPEKPIAGTLLRAVVSGGEGLALRWERNGEALAVVADTLDTTGFKKGDTIRLVAGQKGAPVEPVETVLMNSQPVIRSVSFKPGSFTRGVDVTAEVEGWDADGDAIQYEYLWSINGEALYSETGPTLAGDRFARGDEVSLRVVPYDGEAEGAPFDAQAGAAENCAPRFTSTPPVEFSGTFVYRPKVSDLDQDTVSFSILKGPEGMSVANGAIEWNARGHKGAFEVTLAADDGNGGQSMQTFELKVGE